MPGLPNTEGIDALIRKYDMLPPGAVVICAVSGGADSMCLLHLLSRREDITLHAAHFNHRLRGGEADRDEAFVRNWCRENRIPFHAGSRDVAEEAKRLKMGLEETARALRYTFLYQLARELKADRIATAHNANDNAETLLMHLLRGTALQGLGGIEPRLNALVRPLLTTSRREIEDYLNAYAVPHIEDSTNKDNTFLRNRVRHQLIPLLEEWNPGFVRRITQTIPRLREDEKALDLLARQLFRQASRDREDLVISVQALTDAPEAVSLRCIRLLLAEANEGLGNCTGVHLESVMALCRSPKPSGEVHLPCSLTARRVYDKLVLTHDGPPVVLAPMALFQGANPVPGTDWTVILDGPPWPGLVVRSRQTGDEITLPNGHKRPLKKLFIDRKIPRLERDRIPVVADRNGILAVAGLGSNPAHPCHGQVTIIKETEARENGKE